MPHSEIVKQTDGYDLGSFPRDTTREGYQLVLQRLDLKVDAFWDYQMFMMLQYVPAMMERGFHLLAAGTHLTGVPGQLVHLWRRRAVPGAGADATPAHSYDLGARFAHFVRAEEVTTLTPTAYDAARWLPGDPDAPRPPPPPAATKAGSAGSRVYLIDRIAVQPQRMRAFVEAKRALMIPLLSEKARGTKAPWTLLASGWASGAGSPVAVNVWELPDSDALLRTMRRISENTAYQDFVTSCVRGEDQHLLAPIDAYEPRPIRAGSDANPVIVYRG
jgi:hypothetical protein